MTTQNLIIFFSLISTAFLLYIAADARPVIKKALRELGAVLLAIVVALAFVFLWLFDNAEIAALVGN